jgi:peptide subunit release factor 1 (eRF1)
MAGYEAPVSVVQTARRLVSHRGGHPVLSVYLDLDPERFATPPARASQIRSLLDEAGREVDERREDLSHDEKTALREDLERVRDYLLSREPPYKGARALAVFCSTADDLFETVQLGRSVAGQVVIEGAPYVAPLIEATQQRTWCVALVSRREARVFGGPPDRLTELVEEQDDVHGQHSDGGWSQPRYERSVEKDVDDHLRRAADIVYRLWKRHRYDRLALGGPEEIVPRFEGFCPRRCAAAWLRGGLSSTSRPPRTTPSGPPWPRSWRPIRSGLSGMRSTGWRPGSAATAGARWAGWKRR